MNKDIILKSYFKLRETKEKVTALDVQKDCGLVYSTIYNTLRRNNLLGDIRNGNIPEDDIRESYKNGETIKSLSKRLHKCSKQISKFLVEEGFKINCGYYKYKNIINHDYFEVIDNQDKAYILGIWYSDGNVRKSRNMLQICLHKQDVEILNFIRDQIAPNIKLYNDRTNFRVSISSKKLKEDIIKLGCVPNKTHTLTFPTKEQVPDHLIGHFLRGYFDGDGSVMVRGLNFTGKDSFLLDIHNKIGIEKEFKIYIRHPERNNNIGSACYHGQNFKKIVDFMYTDANFYLKRKYNKIIKIYEKMRGGR